MAKRTTLLPFALPELGQGELSEVTQVLKSGWLTTGPKAHQFEQEFAADAVVLVTQRRSNEALYRELKDSVGIDAMVAEGITGFYRIGDCEAPRLTADAVFSGHRLAREIDTDNPEVPLPFKRERRVIEREAVPT